MLLHLPLEMIMLHLSDASEGNECGAMRPQPWTSFPTWTSFEAHDSNHLLSIATTGHEIHAWIEPEGSQTHHYGALPASLKHEHAQLHSIREVPLESSEQSRHGTSKDHRGRACWSSSVQRSTEKDKKVFINGKDAASRVYAHRVCHSLLGVEQSYFCAHDTCLKQICYQGIGFSYVASSRR
jgi:hypothetical protein